MGNEKGIDKKIYKMVVSSPSLSTDNTELNIKIKYFNHDDFSVFSVPHLNKCEVGNWIDLYTSVPVTIKKGEFCLIPLGVGMKLPDGYEANVVSRSSTFKNYGIIQTNAYGVIDNSYCGNDDEWKFPAYATKDITIPKYSRICQFRVNQIQPKINFIECDVLTDKNRGGFGSTGK